MLKSYKLNFAVVSVIITAFLFISCKSQLFTLSDFDEDGNSSLDQSEFNEVLDKAGYFNYWDADSNGDISEDEWNQGGVGTFSTQYDADDKGAWKTWDLDGNGSLSEDELDNGVFNTIDDNDNAEVSDSEFNTWYDNDLF